MTTTPDRLRLLHGTEAPLPELRPLRAGPVTLLLDGIDLRYLRVGDTELVRRVYTAVRDVDWDTVPSELSNYVVDESDSGFRVEFDARHARGDVDFEWHGAITGDASGRVEYLFDGRARSVCPYNRIGICVHHPWRETKGASFRARTPDGEIDGAFPDLIGQQRFVDGAYHALFPAFDRLEVDLASGGRLLLEFEGDLWETEDHRNWTDANFKTYSTPIALGRPTPLEVGEKLRQRLAITPLEVAARDSAADGPVRLRLGEPTGTRVPPIGLGHDRDKHVPEAREREVLAALSPHHLRVEVRLDQEDWRDALAAGSETARAVDAHLELSLHYLEEHSDELAALADELAGRAPVDRVLVVNADSRTATPAETTRPALVEAAREALGGVAADAAFVGGTEVYFTEINRTRPELASWDGVCYSISPQIHAFTDIDVMENLDAQGETVRSAHALAGGKEVVVSPVTMRRRVNFHAAGDPPPTPPGALPDSVDVRQSALFGGAWTAGSLKYLSETGASAVTYYETSGWRGVVERVGGVGLPDRFPSVPGEVFPLYHPLADAIEWRGGEVLRCESSDVLSAVGLAVSDGDATRLLVANLTPTALEVSVGPLDGQRTLRRLNEETAAEAAGDPHAFRERWEVVAADGELELTLAPYEVVRVDVV
jgi:D-apionolactonase